MTTAFRNIGGGASTGSVSMKVLMRTTRMGRASMARRRWYARSPRLEPRAMMTLAGRLDVDVIRQLVDIIVGAREVVPQLFARAVDGVGDPVGEGALLEGDGQPRRDLVPEPGRHFLVDAAVAEDDE